MRIKKIRQSLGAIGKVADSYTTDNEACYNAPYVNNLHTYSTDEIRIGTYLGKPLYRKMFTLTPEIESATTSASVDVDIAGVDSAFVNPKSTFAENSSLSYKYPLPLVHSSSSVVVGAYPTVQTSKIVLNIRKGNGIAVYSIRLILEYTKTTD